MDRASSISCDPREYCNRKKCRPWVDGGRARLFTAGALHTEWVRKQNGESACSDQVGNPKCAMMNCRKTSIPSWPSDRLAPFTRIILLFCVASKASKVLLGTTKHFAKSLGTQDVA